MGTERPFPVDDFTLDQVEHALDARLTMVDGEPVVVGADFSLPKLLEFMSGYDPSKVVPLRDDDGYETPGPVASLPQLAFRRR